MRDLFDKEFQQEMDDFFDFVDHEVLGKPREDVVELIHEVDGKVVTEPVEDVLTKEEEDELYNSVPPCTSMTPVGDK